MVHLCALVIHCSIMFPMIESARRNNVPASQSVSLTTSGVR